ncbi:hypothetical protein ACHAWO_012389 [Cyclotella atomus]|uniref:HMG box domain-containing protein n=1 Tax=Cyclotella atomus TaxID=382360 RepID=A0ABD3MWN6_9STRA
MIMTKDKTMDDANAIAATSSNNNNSLMMKAKLDDITRTKRVGKHKDGRPLRPLSAYNIFFQLERKRIMKEQGNPDAKHAAGGFGSLASIISTKWKAIDDAVKLKLEAMAKLDRDRYAREMDAWKASKDTAEAVLKIDSASGKTEELPINEVVVDSEPLGEVMSPPTWFRLPS